MPLWFAIAVWCLLGLAVLYVVIPWRRVWDGTVRYVAVGWRRVRERRSSVMVVLGGVLAVALLVLVAWKLPGLLLASYDGTSASREYHELENSIRATAAQILGGVVLLVGVYLTWRRVGALEEQVETARDQQITERFTRAIEQVGNEKLEIPLGGIYALERIARDSKKDHWTIMEVLTAYVRQNARRRVGAQQQWNGCVTDRRRLFRRLC